MRHSFFAFVASASILLISSAPRAQAPAGRIDVASIRAAVERALAVAPRGFEVLQSPAQAGVRVLDVDVRPASGIAEQISIDLSQKTLTYDPSGDVEALLDRCRPQPLNLVAHREEMDGLLAGELGCGIEPVGIV